MSIARKIFWSSIVLGSLSCREGVELPAPSGDKSGVAPTIPSAPHQLATGGAGADSGAGDKRSLLSLIAEQHFPEIAVGDRRIVLLTPGRREEQAAQRAFKFLQEKGVAVMRFTHGRALRTKTGWEVVLLELKDPPIAGGSATVTISEPSLQVENWALGQ